MTVIYVDCDYCNEKPVKLQPDELRLYLSHPSGGGTYVFEHCGQQNWRPANSRVTNTLLAAGVPYETTGEQPRKLRAQDYQTIVLGRLALKSVDTVDDIGWADA